MNSSQLRSVISNMGPQYAPHEPAEEVLSVEDAFRDAERSEGRWRAFEQEEYLRRMLIELPEPAYLTLEELAKRYRISSKLCGVLKKRNGPRC
jgi:hypothetical protein